MLCCAVGKKHRGCPIGGGYLRWAALPYTLYIQGRAWNGRRKAGDSSRDMAWPSSLSNGAVYFLYFGRVICNLLFVDDGNEGWKEQPMEDKEKSYSLWPLFGIGKHHRTYLWRGAYRFLFKPFLEDTGASLIEVVLVVAVLSVGIGTAAHTLRFTDQLRLNHEAEFLAKRLQYVREISRNADDFSASGYRELSLGPCFSLKTGGQGYYYRVGSKRVESWNLPQDIHISCNRQELVFYKDGEATNCTFNLSLGDKKRLVIVDRVGRIRIE